ncbi:MAG: CPXCG motif-containing cysteine-rich protein [Pseudomonadales bacterium]
MSMEPLEEQIVSCPYCGETIEVFVDHQEVGDEYIEDCQVCCRPIIFNVELDSMGNLTVRARDENEVY